MMMLTDSEWLRFVSFALLVGAVLGSLYTGALVVYGRDPVSAMIGAVVGGGGLAALVHIALRWLLDRSDPTAGDGEPDTDTEVNA